MIIAKIINDYLRSKLPDLPKIDFDTFKTEESVIFCRHDAGSVLKQFVNGDRKMSTLFSYVVRGEAGEARSITDSIMNQLYQNQTIEDEDGQTVLIQTVTAPQFASYDAKGNAIYTGSITVQYTVKGEISND